MFAGHNVYKFREDPFYSNGFIPSVRQLVERIAHRPLSAGVLTSRTNRTKQVLFRRPADRRGAARR